MADAETSNGEGRVCPNAAFLEARPRFRRLINCGVAGYWMAMFVGTHIPNPEAIIGPEVSDKLLHFTAYFVLMFALAARHRLLNSRWPAFRRIGSWLLLVSAYAVFDELLQAVPGINRHADVQDALADVFGAGTAAAAVLLWRHLVTRSRPRDSKLTVDPPSQRGAI